MILISPFPPEHARELHRWLNSPRDANFDDFTASDVASVEASLARKTAAGFTFLGQSTKPFAFAAFAAASPVMGWFQGVVLAPEHRGFGHGAAFLRAVVADLRGRGFRKMSAFFNADNDAIRETFRSAGAVEEGYLRAAAMRSGSLSDVRLWSFNDMRTA
jgi:GNAT superfamily N-acetyltransferase